MRVTKKHVERARNIQKVSAAILRDLQEVLEKHGHEGVEITGLTLSDTSTGAAKAATGLCRRWRCWTNPDGSTQCGWVWEPC